MKLSLFVWVVGYVMISGLAQASNADWDETNLPINNEMPVDVYQRCFEQGGSLSCLPCTSSGLGSSFYYIYCRTNTENRRIDTVYCGLLKDCYEIQRADSRCSRGN